MSVAITEIMNATYKTKHFFWYINVCVFNVNTQSYTFKEEQQLKYGKYDIVLSCSFNIYTGCKTNAMHCDVVSQSFTL
jgi:hypothetical protein